MTWTHVGMVATLAGIALLFIVFVLRACWLVFTVKADPIRAIKPPSARALYNALPSIRRERKARVEEKLNAMS